MTLLPGDQTCARLPCADGAKVVVFWFETQDGRRHGFRCTCVAQASGWRTEETATAFAGVHRDRWHGGPAEVAA